MGNKPIKFTIVIFVQVQNVQKLIFSVSVTKISHFVRNWNLVLFLGFRIKGQKKSGDPLFFELKIKWQHMSKLTKKIK